MSTENQLTSEIKTNDVSPQDIQKLIEEQVSKKLLEERQKWEEEQDQAKFKGRYKRVTTMFKRYRLIKDIWGKPKKNAPATISHKVGEIDAATGEVRLYMQDMNDTKTVQFSIKVGDPKYFEYVDTITKKDDVYIPVVEH